jgi:hypothetical protein
MHPAAPLVLLAVTLPVAALANDVGFGLDHHRRLTITGDADANEIEVKYDPDTNSIVIEGKNGTTIRGQASGSVPLPADPDTFPEIIVSTSLGDDKVTVDLSGLPEGKRPEKVTVEDEGSQGGNDTVTLKNVHVAGKKGTLAIKPGDGNDTTVVEGCDAELVSIRDRVGDNSITVKDCNIGGILTIEPSNGKNTVEVKDTFYEDSVIRPKGTAGVEPSLKARIERTTGRKISFGGTGGPDEITFEDNVVEQASAKLGDGDDWIGFTGSTIENVSIDGGRGEADCYDESVNHNVFGSIKVKGFEPCGPDLVLEYFAFGADPSDDPPDDAVAWRTNNPEIGHRDGPYALPGVANPLGLQVRDPRVDIDGAHWADVDECDWIHLHSAFAGHGDPAPGPPATKSACGHGALEYARPDEDI